MSAKAEAGLARHGHMFSESSAWNRSAVCLCLLQNLLRSTSSLTV